ncbi:MAG: hypothetical protein RLZZ163_1036, partial [Actinomycetota bacterium]
MRTRVQIYDREHNSGCGAQQVTAGNAPLDLIDSLAIDRGQVCHPLFAHRIEKGCASLELIRLIVAQH